jgi:hypothetical protein
MEANKTSTHKGGAYQWRRHDDAFEVLAGEGIRQWPPLHRWSMRVYTITSGYLHQGRLVLPEFTAEIRN